MNGEARFVAAIGAIDQANEGDPNVLVVDGVERPKEQTHAEMMTDWVGRLDPAADDAQLLAARAHHLRRWVNTRKSYPEGRRGYLRWRADQKREHASLVGEILLEVGYDQDTIDKVQRIVRKEALRSDPAVQTHEDALCLVFLDTQFVALADEVGEPKMIEIVAKTLRKMSPAGIEAALTLDLPDREVEVLRQASAASLTLSAEEASQEVEG